MKSSTCLFLGFILLTFSLGSAFADESMIFRINTPDGLNLRDAPTTQGKILALIPGDAVVTMLEEKGDTFTIQGATGKWAKVQWKDMQGWVFGGFLERITAPASANGGYVTASSAQSDLEDPARHQPSKAFDNNPLTCWVEDAYWVPSIEIDFGKSVSVDEIRVMPGNFDPALWKAYRRIESATIYLDGFSMKKDFRDDMEAQSIDLTKVVNFRKFTFVIHTTSYVEDAKGDAVSEIQFFSNGKQLAIDIENFQYKPQYSTERISGAAVVNTDGISLLDKPDSGANTVSRLPKGARVSLYEMTRSPIQIDNTCSYWFGVESDGFRGYCFGYFLDILDSGDVSNYSFNSMVKDFNSSGFLQQDTSDPRFHPAKAFDGDPHSFWTGNEKNGGIGDFLEIIFFKPQQCKEIKILPGAFQEDLFGKYNRVKKATIRLDAFPITVDFTDSMESRVVNIPGDMNFSRFKITIDEAYPGGVYNRPSISDIFFGRGFSSFNFRIPAGFLPGLSGKSIHHAAIPYFYSVYYFFPDGTYVKISGEYEKYIGLWKTDAEGDVETYATKRYYIKGVGDRVPIGTQFESELFEDYIYTEETINYVSKINLHHFTIDFDHGTGSQIVYELQDPDYEVRNTKLTPEIEKYIEEKKARYKEFIEQNGK